MTRGEGEIFAQNSVTSFMDGPKVYHTVFISKICPYFAVGYFVLENIVILCFERCFSKQNSVIRLK